MRLSSQVVIPINCDAMLLQPAKQGKNETLRREGRERERERERGIERERRERGRGEEREREVEGERERGRGSATLPCGCALPHIADAAFESLGGVPEGADTTVPVAVVSRLFGLSFWPYEIRQMLRSS